MNNGAAGRSPAQRGEGSTSLKGYLYDRLRDAAEPVFVFDGTTIPGASVWTGSRHWVDSFRNQGLSPGDRLLVDLPPGPVLLQVVVAAAWNRLSLCFDSSLKEEDPLEVIDARGAVLSEEAELSVPCEAVWRAEGLAGPNQEPESPRDARWEPSPEIRFWLSSSGTLGRSRCYGLSDANLLSVLRSHDDVLEDTETMLSYLPWDHCFGLVFDLLYALHNEMTLVRDAQAGRSPENLIRLLNRHPVDHLNMVPTTVEALDDAGFTQWSQLREGIVGGAPITENVSEVLKGTNLRVGYGQTEASPGITLGSSGEFEPRLLGQPVGCEVSLDDQDQIHFHGNNAHRAELDRESDEFRYHPVPRSVATGDLGARGGGKLFYQGRLDHRFKLSNGRFVDPLVLEETFNQELPEGFVSVVIPSEDGSFRLLVEGNDVEPARIRERFESTHSTLARYLKGVTVCSEGTIPRTSKGEVDRRKLRDGSSFTGHQED